MSARSFRLRYPSRYRSCYARAIETEVLALLLAHAKFNDQLANGGVVSIHLLPAIFGPEIIDNQVEILGTRDDCRILDRRLEGIVKALHHVRRCSLGHH